ncbi:efflux transporter outer membrane subunit [Pandoraea vervacti]|uniref:efflux transporter outer membrane subunit n=1 Tax=Pandoraea vervacti TaxID=656178 RepID=UPI003AACE57A
MSAPTISSTWPVHGLRRSALALASAAALLAGCAGVRHDPLPAVPVPAQWAGAPMTGAPSDASASASNTASATRVATIAPAFWRAFGDPVLDTLITDALAVNNDLAAAGIRVYRAQLQAGLADTNLTPSVTVGGTGTVSRTLDTHAMARKGTLQATASYELDLWGKLAAQRDAARWEYEATDADREAARLSLIATTAQLYWTIGFLNQQIANTQSNIVYTERILALVRSRYAAGAVSGLDVAQTEGNLADQRATLTQLVQQRTENRNALAILFDRPPEQAAAEPSVLPTQALPDVPAGLPAALLGRRPDLRASELRLRGTLANVDITRTSFYPTFTLTGQLGTTSASLERVLQNPVGSLGLGLALPFIQWNTMQLQIKVSQTQYEEAVVNFRKSLFTALSEVENALSAREQLTLESEQRVLSLTQAQRAETLLRSRYQAGAIGVQPWLEQLRLLRAAQTADAQTRLSRLNNRMTLYKALGGAGNASDVTPPPAG